MSRKWSKSEDGGVWIPESNPSRRAVIRGASAGAAVLLLGCGDGGNAGGPGTDPSRGSGGSGVGTGGKPGTGGSAASGGAPGTGGASAAGGTPGTGGAAPGSGGAGAGGAPGTGGDGGASAVDGGGSVDTGGSVIVDGGTDLGGAPSMGTPSCIVRPQQIEGPFPSKMMLNRSDVRSEPGGTDPKPGLALQLVIRVGQMAGGACKVYQGVAVDYWQCDAGGIYSSYASQGTAGKAYLRGYQMTDTSGTAEFKSIFPGSYPGRAVHVHFGIRTNPAGSGRHFISQLYFPEEILAEVFAKAPYSAHKPQRNSSDSYYNDGGSKLIPKMTKNADGWLAEFDIGLA